MKRGEDTSDSSSKPSKSTPTERPGLVTLPPDLGRRLVGFLDGDGLGGTQDLYALSCTHRSLASCAGLATRLDNVRMARLADLLAAFDRDRQRLRHRSDQGGDEQEPLTRAPTGLIHLSLARQRAIDADEREAAYAIEDAFACEIEAEESGLKQLMVLDLSPCDWYGKIGPLLEALGRNSCLRTLRLPAMIDETDRPFHLFHLSKLPAKLAQVLSLREIEQTASPYKPFFRVTMEMAAAHPESSRLLESLILAGPHVVPMPYLIRAPSPEDGGMDDISLQRYCHPLKPGAFANLRVLRLEAYHHHVALTAVGMVHLGDAWVRGVFGSRLEDFCLRGGARVTRARGLPQVLAAAWRQLKPDALENLQVLRLHDFFVQFDEAVALMDYFGAAAADGRWDRLRVLDLTDCVLGDIGMLRLAAAIEAGFAKSLEELDLSFNRNTGQIPTHATYVGPEGVRALCSALRSNEHISLKRLRLNGQQIGDDGVEEIVAAWREGSGALDGLEELCLRDCALTDESVSAMVQSGFLGHRFGWDDEQSTGASRRPPPLQRLVLAQNDLTGTTPPLPDLLRLNRSSMLPTTLLTRLDLARNDSLPSIGLQTLLGLLGAGTKDLRLGCPEGGVGPAADGDEMLHVVLRAAGQGSPVLQDLRRLDIRKLPVSRAQVGTFVARLRLGLCLAKLCQLELACPEVRTASDAVRLREELIQARKPLVWDVLTINRKGPA